VGADTYISYDAYKSAMDEFERTGVAPCITLPFAARQGHVVNIGGREYRLEAPVTEDGASACGTTLDGKDIVGFTVARL
jgi:hypothetical protein